VQQIIQRASLPLEAWFTRKNGSKSLPRAVVLGLSFFSDFSDFLIFLDFDHLLDLGDQMSDCIACRYGAYGYYSARLGCVLAFLTLWGSCGGQKSNG